jgi:hypothetical protein
MPPKSESRKQLEEMDRQMKAESMPPVVNHGMEISGDVMKAAKLKDAESRMTATEHKQYQRERTSKYGYPPVK